LPPFLFLQHENTIKFLARQKTRLSLHYITPHLKSQAKSPLYHFESSKKSLRQSDFTTFLYQSILVDQGSAGINNIPRRE